MRIASTQYHSTMNTALQNATGKLQQILQKMATGQRHLLPSESPVTNVRLSRLAREEAAFDQYRENIAVLQNRLLQNEQYLQGMVNDMLSARDLMVWAADGSNTSEDVRAMAASLRPIMDSIFYTANTKDAEGKYVFSGTLSDTPAITYDAAAPVGSRYTFTGNTGEQRVAVGHGITQPANISLSETADWLNRLESAYETLRVPGVNVNDPAVRAEIVATLDTLDVALDATAGMIARLGGAQNILSTLDNNHASVSLAHKQAALILGQLDYADAAVKLNGYSAAVEATQKAYSRISKLSLFDVL